MQGDASPNLRKYSFQSSKNIQEFIKNIVTVPANTQMTILFFEKLTIRKKSQNSKTLFQEIYVIAFEANLHLELKLSSHQIRTQKELHKCWMKITP